MKTINYEKNKMDLVKKNHINTTQHVTVYM